VDFNGFEATLVDPGYLQRLHQLQKSHINAEGHPRINMNKSSIGAHSKRVQTV
jgi:hypothetical protein